MMVHTDLAALLGNAAGQEPAGDMTAMVGLAGAVCGVLSIRCSSEVAESIAGKMLGSTGKVQSSDITDAIAEITNMVAGNFKSKISMLGDHCLLSVPTVIRGNDYEMVSLADGEHIVVGAGYDGSPMWFCLELHS
jgi:chemotaxis protein CheX